VLIVSALSLGWRHFQTVHLPRSKELQAIGKASFEAILTGSTLLPVLTWGILANRTAQVVMDTHVWAYPKMMIASQQMAVVAILFLAVILSLDLSSRWLHARNLGQSSSLSLPSSSILVVGLVVLDWLLSEIAWWTLIFEHGSLAVGR
jgi:hypothetical protein